MDRPSYRIRSCNSFNAQTHMNFNLTISSTKWQLQMRAKRSSEMPAQRELRLQKRRDAYKKRKDSETAEERERRRLTTRSHRANETPEQRDGVLCALQCLVENNIFYRDVTIDTAVLTQLPVDGDLSALFIHCQYCIK